MKTKTGRSVVVIVLVIVLSLTISQSASAAAQSALPPDALSIVLKMALGFASLVGLSKLTAVLVQIVKIVGLASDGTANKWAAGFNLLLFAGLVYFGVFQPQVAVDILDGQAGQVAEVALFVLGFILQMTGTQPAYVDIRNARIPLLSYSHTGA